MQVYSFCWLMWAVVCTGANDPPVDGRGTPDSAAAAALRDVRLGRVAEYLAREREKQHIPGMSVANLVQQELRNQRLLETLDILGGITGHLDQL